MPRTLTRCSFAVFAAVAMVATLAFAPTAPRAQSAEAERTVEALSRACRGEFAMACGALLALDMDRMPRPEALARASKACDAGSPLACTAWGLLLADADPAAAQRAYARACDGGDPSGCYNLAAVRWRSGDPLLRASAVQLFYASCDQQIGAACTALGEAFARGDGVSRNPQEARRRYRLGCDAGHGRGYALLAEDHRERGDWPRAARLFERACGGGDTYACLRLGFAFEDGRGLTADPGRAAAAYERACTGGSGDGCASLGFLYLDGRGLKADKRRARSLFDRGCYLDQASTAACVVFGDMLRDGAGGPRSARAAVKAYNRACRDDEALGCLRLSTAFTEGAGIRKSADLARRYRDRACKLGHADACEPE